MSSRQLAKFLCEGRKVLVVCIQCGEYTDISRVWNLEFVRCEKSPVIRGCWFGTVLLYISLEECCKSAQLAS